MRKLVLTSSEVSLLASLAIVVLCTLALFLSGYAIQQRTLRDLRAAIRPRESRPSPRAHLHDDFETDVIIATQHKSDGSDGVDGGETVPLLRMSPLRPMQRTAANKADGERSGAVVEALKAQVVAKLWGVEKPDPRPRDRVPITRAERRRLIREEIQRLAQAEQPKKYHRRLW